MIEQGSKGVFAIPKVLIRDAHRSISTHSNRSPIGSQAKAEQNMLIKKSQQGANYIHAVKTDSYNTSTHQMQRRYKDRSNHIDFKHCRPRSVVSFKSPPPSRLQHAGRALLKSVSTVFLRKKERDEKNGNLPSFANRSRYEQTDQDVEDSRFDLFTVSPTRMLHTNNESHFSELTPSGHMREPIKFVEVESLPLFEPASYTNLEEQYSYCQ